jgi:hypothetical protein
MTKLTITTAERDLGIDMYVRDHMHLVQWLYVRYEHAPLVWAEVEKHALIALAHNEDSLVHWRKLASFAFTELKTIEADRELTPLERRIRDIAEGCYDSSVKAAAAFGIDLFPEDTDRAAARRERDAAVERALNEMRPFLKTKETIQ